MLGVLLLLSLSSLVDLVPPPRSPPVLCRRCCDDLEPAEGSGEQPTTAGFDHVPEVRTYINMTILKGRSKATKPDTGLTHVVKNIMRFLRNVKVSIFQNMRLTL